MLSYAADKNNYQKIRRLERNFSSYQNILLSLSIASSRS